MSMPGMGPDVKDVLHGGPAGSNPTARSVDEAAQEALHGGSSGKCSPTEEARSVFDGGPNTADFLKG